MSEYQCPDWFRACIFSNEEAMTRAVKSGTKVASGFATSEPSTFYQEIWRHIQNHDLHDLDFRQALFMAPHTICVGKALSATGLFAGWDQRFHNPALSRAFKTLNDTTKKLEGMKKLIEHYRELRERRITFTSAFIGPATNMIIPSNPLVNLLYPEFRGRNTSTMGITDMHAIHFPDAVDSIGFDPDERPLVDTVVVVMTTPNETGELSHGPANGANAEIVEKILRLCNVNLLLYLNPNYPFTRGYSFSPNTLRLEQFRELARAGRLFVVEDSGKIPALPPDAFKNPHPVEQAIAHNVANHIELNLRYTAGRAIQVGFGSTGVLAIKALKDSSWTGRSYTEMLEPFTLDLFDAGKIAGSHFIERDGRRTQLEGKMVCTFTICEQNSDFYRRLHLHPDIYMAAASHVVIPEAFHYGLGVNNCLGIDFYGHVNSSGRDRNHYSGIGGAAIIMRGLSRGGIGYLCLKSTHVTPEGVRRSSVFPFMPPGTPISHVGPDLMGGREGARFFLVTEHGVALLSGKSQHNFIRNIIAVAHPDFRDELKRQAYENFRVSA
jgi:acyl-CoA hydrolase